jgi:hypothetical protein
MADKQTKLIMADEQTKRHGTSDLADRLKLPVGAILVMGINTGSGKSSLSRLMGAFFASAKVPVRTLRIETGERRAEFPDTDLFIDVNRTAEAANTSGDPAALLDEVWEPMSETIGAQGVVVIDCGAGAQNFLLLAAATAGLADLIAKHGAGCAIIVVTTPEAECGRQAARLVSDARESMPDAQILLAVTHVNAAQQSRVGSPGQQAFIKLIASLKGVTRIDVPFCRGQALDTFSSSSILEIVNMRSDEELMRRSGKGVLSSRAAQTHLFAWYSGVTNQLQRVFWP